MLYPLKFHPIFKERVWGGRNLERVYHKTLPPRVAIGESWEISDRPGDVSVIANGPLANKDLRWLMEHHERELLGDAANENGRFPLLIKILDAEEKLSLQVHPPAGQSAPANGEPKTEMWYITQAKPGAELYVGLRRGMTRAEFERRIQAGTVADCFHRVRVRAGDAMFLPSGRVHAIGAGLLLFEIQQNSDTTYRVFDWNRTGTDGKPRELHVAESLASINFDDFEPELLGGSYVNTGQISIRPLVSDRLFRVDALHSLARGTLRFRQSRLRVIGVLRGQLTIKGGGQTVELNAGEFCLIPGSVKEAELTHDTGSAFLRAEPGDSSDAFGLL